ncbi:MAG TPA: hypothetical protein VNC16_11415 [Solirubrobacterales bacterium]|jgi:hypothetical protein|nr:hypothetical protein [Solirubrobacterales bacterium]
MYNKLALVALALAAITAFSVGCGSSDGETTAAITKAQFLKEGNAICWETVKTQDAAFQQVLKEGMEEEATKFDPQKQKAFIQEVAGSVDNMVDELTELGTPAGDEAAVSRILAQYEDGASKAEANPEAFLSGEAFKEANAAAKAYGLEKCGQM